jgi:hypothetical protein
MRIILDRNGVEDALDHSRTLLLEYFELYVELHEHFVKDRDGYPTSSLGGGSPSNEVDEDGIPLPPRSDPVAAIVIARDEGSGNAGQALAQFVNSLQHARRTLEGAVVGARRVLQPPPNIVPQEDIWCVNCLRAGVKSARATEGRFCTWCRDDKTERGVYPSPRLVDAHTRRVRLTEADRAGIAQQDAEQRRARKRGGVGVTPA